MRPRRRRLACWSRGSGITERMPGLRSRVRIAREEYALSPSPGARDVDLLQDVGQRPPVGSLPRAEHDPHRATSHYHPRRGATRWSS